MRTRDELLTVGEIAAELRVSRATIWRLCRTGELPHLRVGSVYRIRRSDLDEYLARTQAQR